MTTRRIAVFDREVELAMFDDDHVTNIIASTDSFYEIELLEDIFRRTSKGQLAVDVGAHIGNHTVFLAAVADLDVIAVEPFPPAAELLIQNVARNGLTSRVEIVRAAAGAEEARATVVAGEVGNTGMTKIVLGGDEVQVTTLDRIVGQRPVAVIKVDVEGWESEVLKGARGVIQRDEPLIYVEVADARDERMLRELLSDLGYRFAREFNATPTRLFLPTGTSLPAIYPPFLAELATEQTRVVTQLARTVNRMERRVVNAVAGLDALVKRWDGMVGQQEREMREYREQLRKTTSLFSELYKRTRAATQSGNDLLASIAGLQETLDRLANVATDGGDGDSEE